jgi:hypothetical protein
MIIESDFNFKLPSDRNFRLTNINSKNVNITTKTIIEQIPTRTPEPTPTNTPSPTLTPTPTPTVTSSPTPTPTESPTPTPTVTSSPTPTPTESPTPTPIPTPIPTNTPTPTPTPTFSLIPFHILMESLGTTTPADGSRGNHRFLNSFNYAALPYIGFKLGPFTRIKNCKLTFTKNNYIAEFGTDTNWNIIKYFPAHDITITADGIGRSGSSNFGNGWSYDICGFYLDIPTDVLLTETEIIVDYEYTSNSQNKNGVGFWSNSQIVAGLGGSVDTQWIGTWDNTPYARLAPELTRTQITSQASISSGTLYNKRIIIRSIDQLF